MRPDYLKLLHLVDRLSINIILTLCLYSVLNRTVFHSDLINGRVIKNLFLVTLTVTVLITLISKNRRGLIASKFKKLFLNHSDKETFDNVSVDTELVADESEQKQTTAVQCRNGSGQPVFMSNDRMENIIPVTWPKIIRYGILPVFLLIASWWLFSINPFFDGSDFRFLVKEVKQFDHYNGGTKNLLKGEKITGIFTATENGLSAFAVRINTQERINTDEITFRIKEESRPEWYFEDRYQSENFINEAFYQFEFPVIENSEKKVYLFEIESARGRQGNAVAVSKSWPAYRAIYQPMITEGKINLNRYLIKKANSLLDSSDFRFSLVLSFSFFLLYFGFLFLPKIRQIVHLILALYMLFVFWEMFYTIRNYDFNYIILTGLWLTINYFFGFKEQLSIKLGIFFLLLCSLFLLSGNDLLAEKTSVWAYLYLLSGVIIAGVDSLLKKTNVYKKQNTLQ